jgi:hypothetical protein
MSRPTYAQEIKDRSRWVTEKFSRTGPDVVFAIEVATHEHLKTSKVEPTAENIGALAADKDQQPARDAIMTAAQAACKYVNKTNVPRCLEAHALQMNGTLTDPPEEAPAEEPPAEDPPADAPKADPPAPKATAKK